MPRRKGHSHNAVRKALVRCFEGRVPSTEQFDRLRGDNSASLANQAMLADLRAGRQVVVSAFALEAALWDIGIRLYPIGGFPESNAFVVERDGTFYPA